MKIAIDAGCLGIRDDRLKVGVYIVVSNLLKELGKIDRKNIYYLYSFYPIEKNLLKSFGKNMHNIVIPSFGWLYISLPFRLLVDQPDIFIAASQALPLILPFTKYKVLGIFYDIAFEKYPELYSYAANVERHKRNSKDLAQYADLLIAISESTKKDVVQYYGINSKKIIVAYPGIGNKILKRVQDDREKSSRLRSNNKNPYFLFVGAFKKSKNIPTLLKAFSLFLKKSKKRYDLLLVGGDKWMDPEIEETLAALPENVQQAIKIRGFVDEKTLQSLYHDATAFVSPSWYEGFGLPFLEAQSYDCPVIASNRGSLPEVLGDSAILIGPTSIKDLSDAMKEIAINTTLCTKLSAKGSKNVQKYSWKTFARLVQSAIASL